MGLIESLPLEVLQRIGEHLDETQSLALASKRCFDAVAPTLYANIVIFYSTPRQLRLDVARWTLLLEKFAIFQHVRRLDLKPESQMALYCDFWDPEDEGLGTKWQWLGFKNKFAAEDNEDRIWQPVVELIHLLPGLNAVHYSCRPQLPASLFKAIESRADCRLHLSNFNLRSLHRHDSEHGNALEPYEHSLMTSLHVRSMTICGYEQHEDDELLSHMMQAALAMTSGVAPNLDAVSIYYPEGNFLSGEHFNVSLSQQEWQDTEFGKLSDSTRGSLRFLELAGTHICTIQGLERWAQATYFSRLTTLKIWSNVGTKILKWLTETDLDSLRTIVLDLDAGQDEGDGNFMREKTEIQSLLIAFLEKNVSITTLKLLGDCHAETVAEVLRHRRTTLQHFSAYLTKHIESHYIPYRIRAIDERWRCASLKELSVPVVRSNGDQKEVRQYEWIGRNFPQLRRLNLLMDCCELGPSVGEDQLSDKAVNIHSIAPSDLSQFRFANDDDNNTTDEDYIWRRGNTEDRIYDLRYVMRNYAVDSALAEAIFRRVSRSKPSQSVAFESLRLRIRKDKIERCSMPTDFDRMCKYVLGKNWLCELDLLDRQKKRLLTKEITVPHCGPPPLQAIPHWSPVVIAIFHTEWPLQEGKLWTDCWCSRTLAGDD